MHWPFVVPPILKEVQVDEEIHFSVFHPLGNLDNELCCFAPAHHHTHILRRFWKSLASDQTSWRTFIIPLCEPCVWGFDLSKQHDVHKESILSSPFPGSRIFTSIEVLCRLSSQIQDPNALLSPLPPCYFMCGFLMSYSTCTDYKILKHYFFVASYKPEFFCVCLRHHQVLGQDIPSE